MDCSSKCGVTTKKQKKVDQGVSSDEISANLDNFLKIISEYYAKGKFYTTLNFEGLLESFESILMGGKYDK